MTAIRMQVVLNPDRDPADQFVNTWWCAPDGATDPDVAASAFASDLQAFYQAIDSTMASFVNGSTPTWKAYNMADPKPRQAIDEGVMTALSANTTITMPHELAVVLSFHGQFVSGQNPARRRGRVYLGPWATTALNTSNGLVNSTTYSAIQTAADALLAASDASTAYSWVVYSPTTDTAGLGGVGVYNVVGGWVDNAFDIQRSRGIAPSVRLTFS